MIILKQHQAMYDYINKILESDFEYPKAMCIGCTDKDGKLIGVTAFSEFTHWGCTMNVASTHPRFLTREFVKACFHYVFVTCGKIRATTITRAGNEKSIKMQKGLGFIEEARLKNAYGEEDGILFRMLKTECKWL